MASRQKNIKFMKLAPMLYTILLNYNSLLTPRFVQHFSENASVNLFAVYAFKYKLFIKILSSSPIVDKHCNDVCCDEFSVPQIDRKSK